MGREDSNSVTGEKSTKVLRFFTTLILDDEPVTLNLFLLFFCNLFWYMKLVFYKPKVSLKKFIVSS